MGELFLLRKNNTPLYLNKRFHGFEFDLWLNLSSESEKSKYHKYLTASTSEHWVKVKNVRHDLYLLSSCQQDLFGLWEAWFDLAKQFRSLSSLHTKTTHCVWQPVPGHCNSVTLELLVGGKESIWARRVSQFSRDTYASHISQAGTSYLNHLLFSEELMVFREMFPAVGFHHLSPLPQVVEISDPKHTDIFSI